MLITPPDFLQKWVRQVPETHDFLRLLTTVLQHLNLKQCIGCLQSVRCHVEAALCSRVHVACCRGDRKSHADTKLRQPRCLQSQFQSPEGHLIWQRSNSKHVIFVCCQNIASVHTVQGALRADCLFNDAGWHFADLREWLCCLQGVAELQQQVAGLKLERSQLLKAVTESQHDAACLAEHVRQIGQLKQVLASVQQENAELSKSGKVRLQATASLLSQHLTIC